MIHARSLTKVFGTNASSRKALDDVTLSLDSSKVTAVIGRNGSGKSSLLKALAADLPLDSGTICHANGNPILPDQVGFLTQNPSDSVFEGLTIFEQFFLVMNRDFWAWQRTKEEVGRAVNLLVEGIFDARLGAYPEDLSGGERQLLAALLFLVRKGTFSLLLLDEPTSALSLKNATNFWTVVLRLLETSEGAPCLLATHDFGEAENYAHRVIVMEEGKIIDEFSKGDSKFSRTHFATFV